MHLVTFRRGRSQGRVGAIWHDAVMDLGAIARDLAAQRGAVGRGRGGFPRTMLELVEGGDDTRARVQEAWEAGKRLVDAQGIEDLAGRRLAFPLAKVRLLAPIVPPRNVFCLGRNYADHAAERGAAVPEHPVYFKAAA
jgi:2-keto-4-pentenoate hydratase/2-oxohepta-3-ene-1,7-dioic acid hydratase in catechol pathway